MSSVCKFTALASRDLESILDYVAEQSSVDVAESVLKKINKKCQRLATFPSTGRRRDELSLGVRSVPVDNFLIFYRATDLEIEILRVVSGYRDLDRLFEEK